MAALTQAEDARRYLARKLDNLAHEAQRQTARVTTGDTYQPRQIAVRLAAVEEAMDILDAYEETIRRMVREGAA
jgi:hypothetical protein